MQKMTKLRNELKEQNLDGLIITNPYNRRYISGFTGTAGIVLITQDEQIFLTDFRYMEQAAKQAVGYTIIEHKQSIIKKLAEVIDELDLSTVGFEEDDLTYQTYKAYAKEINAELTATSGIIANIRMIKTEAELQVMEEAAAISDKAYDHILSFVKPGMTEIEVSNELEFFMRQQGATSSSFDIIVASGVRSALPHGVATDKKIASGELVTLDFGALYKGYCSDMTRTFAVGEISDELRKIYDTVLEAHMRGIQGTKAGMTGKEADALTRDYIKAEGYGDYFGHGTGHGLGMEVHEGPRLSPMGEVMLKENMVVTVEPGIYVPDVGGGRIEDDIVITKDGNRSLNKAPKQLIIV
ncbi:Xaa-Pro dipeptidase [Halolactibacillus miurensis]|uniref:Xaa-Pro aminopeptidase n=1 Tax=Halolactibacillus miurensis TaxID=306541 RepID=A0A1I6PS60_9BACI|nr:MULTISPECIES: Xaa-Pro peptidase family protein [Halolactibacillus]GEM04417.1 Xaa-Pro dipeptidase [Halolactibacillus miurensis]SFS43043.1 Xaa-Pro aminopeptidase [Halolactibacillus miurensis]